MTHFDVEYKKKFNWTWNAWRNKKRSKQREFMIIIYSSWSFFLILIPSTGLWKAELTDRMTEQTQNSWNGDLFELFSSGFVSSQAHTGQSYNTTWKTHTHSKLIYLYH